MKCPFCNLEGDYDLPGLKYHLLNICSIFAEIENL